MRQSMSWLHTWSGLLLGWLLFAIFLTGTTAYFRQEITAWMEPETAASSPSRDAARIALAKLSEVGEGASQWRIDLPTDRRNDLSISWQKPEVSASGPMAGRDGGESARGANGMRGGGNARGNGGEGQRMARPERTESERAGGERTDAGRSEHAGANGNERNGNVSNGGERSGGERSGGPRGNGGGGDGGHGRGGERMTLDAGTGDTVTPRDTAGGNFLYRFHFQLYSLPRGWGRWIVGIATMAMFVAIVSGIITHKKIFKDFFTFRPAKGQRSWLDFHNVMAVLALPFHIMITYSGLLLLAGTLLPMTANAVRNGGEDQMHRRAEAADERQLENLKERAGKTAPESGGESGGKSDGDMAPLDPMIARAESEWGQPVSRIAVSDPGTPHSVIVLYPTRNDSLALRSFHGGLSAEMSFAGTSGAYLGEEVSRPGSWVSAIDWGLGSLHRGLFATPLLRWLYFLTGVGGTAMVGTGLVLWSVKRSEKRRGEPGHWGHRLVDVLNVGGVCGLLVALGGYFWANRLLPVALEGRAEWEVACFFLVWLAGLIHALVRPLKQAWTEQLVIAGLLFALIPVLNLLTSHAHLGVTVPAGNWIVAGFDITACVIGVALLHAARKLTRHQGRPARQPRGVRPPAAGAAAPVPAE